MFNDSKAIEAGITITFILNICTELIVSMKVRAHPAYNKPSELEMEHEGLLKNYDQGNPVGGGGVEAISPVTESFRKDCWFYATLVFVSCLICILVLVEEYVSGRLNIHRPYLDLYHTQKPSFYPTGAQLPTRRDSGSGSDGDNLRSKPSRVPSFEPSLEPRLESRFAPSSEPSITPSFEPSFAPSKTLFEPTFQPIEITTDPVTSYDLSDKYNFKIITLQVNSFR